MNQRKDPKGASKKFEDVGPPLYVEARSESRADVVPMQGLHACDRQCMLVVRHRHGARPGRLRSDICARSSRTDSGSISSNFSTPLRILALVNDVQALIVELVRGSSTKVSVLGHELVPQRHRAASAQGDTQARSGPPPAVATGRPDGGRMPDEVRGSRVIRCAA